MAALEQIGRAILLSLPSAQLQPLLRRLKEIAESAPSAMERAVAADLITALRGWED